MSARDPIVRIDLHPLHVPFREEVRAALQGGSGKVAMSLNVDDHWLGGDFLICKMTTEGGVTGVGEAFVWLVESGVSPTLMADLIRDHLARFVLGRSAFDIEAINAKFDDNVARNEMAKGVLDLALHDVAARSIGRPVHDLCGGAQLDKVPLCMVLPLASVDVICALARQGLAMGVRAFRCKLGDGLTKDVAIMSAMRELVGPEVALRVDFNQAYGPNQALAVLDAIAPYGVDFAEQPVRADDFAGMAKLQAQTRVPLMATRAPSACATCTPWPRWTRCAPSA